MEPTSLPPAQQVAAILFSIQPNTAARLLAGFTQSEIEAVAIAAVDLKKWENDQIDTLGKEFRRRIGLPSSNSVNQQEIISRLSEGLNDDHRAKIEALVTGRRQVYGGDFWANVEAPTVAAIIERQRPPLACATLSALPSGLAEKVMGALSRSKKERCLDGILAARPPSAEVADQLLKCLQADLDRLAEADVNPESFQRVSELCNAEGDGFSEIYIEHLAGINPQWAALVRESVVTFASLYSLPKDKLQLLTESGPLDPWVDALQGAPDEFIQKVLAGIPSRARKSIEQEILQKTSRISAEEIERARGTICRKALILLKEPTSGMGGRG